MDLSSPADLRRTFYRLTGMLAQDPALTRGGNPVDAVASEYLTRGLRVTQRWLLDQGYRGWLKTEELVFTGSHEEPMGRYAPLPVDLLRAYGDRGQSAVVDSQGKPWGQMVTPDDVAAEGNGFYFRGDDLVLLKGASPPAPANLVYHYRHPAVPVEEPGAFVVDIPVEARPLVPAEAAFLAMEESWVPGDSEMTQKLTRARQVAREEARRVARLTKDPRRMKPVLRYGNHW